MRGVRRGFLLSEAELRIPKRNCVFRKIKMRVTLRRDAMIMLIMCVATVRFPTLLRTK